MFPFRTVPAACAAWALGAWVAGSPLAAAELKLPRELHKVTVGEVTAHFGGERDKDDKTSPLEYSVNRLWFTFRGDRRTYVFRPQGTLHFSDWRFNIFSPDGRRVLLLQDRFGPYHVVETARLRPYLRGAAKPDAVASGKDRASSSAGVHHDARWVSANTIEYKFTCCGQTQTKTYLVKSGQ